MEGAVMLKRSPLKRKTPLQNRTPMKRASTRLKSEPSAHKPKRRKASTATRWRSEVYLSWVRSLPCCVCGASTGIAAHHLIGMWGLSGMGLTAPDSFAMPACDPIYGHTRDCHQQIHADKTLRDRQPGFIRDTISRGVRRFDGEIKAHLVEAWTFLDEQERKAPDDPLARPRPSADQPLECAEHAND